MNVQTFQDRSALRLTFVIVFCLAGASHVLARQNGCPSAVNYFTRDRQPAQARSTPYPADKIPEALSGFQHPLQGIRFASNKSGNGFAQEDSVSYSCGTIHHPGVDLNKSGCANGDCNLPVVSVADGVVVWVGDHDDWQGIMVQHKYKGEMVLAGYGHVVSIDRKLSVGSKVSKGQYLAKVGSVGAKSCHLHLEIRKIEKDKRLMNGAFFCDNRSNDLVNRWYYSPEPFIDSRPAYNPRPNISLSVPADPVRRSGWNDYVFTVGVTERGGSQVNIDKVYLDGRWYTGKSFFGTSVLKPNRSLSARVKIDRLLWRDQTIEYQIHSWNTITGRWDVWIRLITLRRSL
jgi:murein DD-endopeptidase MepM/ murein hydrolase activator NlpD